MFGGSGNFFVWKLLLPLLLYGILEWCSPLFPFGGLCNAILVCWIDDIFLFRSSAKRYVWAGSTLFVWLLRRSGNHLVITKGDQRWSVSLFVFLGDFFQGLIALKELMNQILVSAHHVSLFYVVTICHMGWKEHTRL